MTIKSQKIFFIDKYDTKSIEYILYIVLISNFFYYKHLFAYIEVHYGVICKDWFLFHDLFKVFFFFWIFLGCFACLRNYCGSVNVGLKLQLNVKIIIKRSLEIWIKRMIAVCFSSISLITKCTLICSVHIFTLLMLC